MIKELKKDSRKISKRVILSCMVITAVTISNCSMAKAIDTNNTIATNVSSAVNINGGHKFIIDSPSKSYDDINKAEKVTGFKFKVPDFLPKDYHLDGISVEKASDSENAVEIFFDTSNKKLNNITLQVSKSNHIEALKSIEKRKNSEASKIDAEEKSMKLGNINGSNVTLTITSPAEKLKDEVVKDEFTEVNKYFVWQNDGISYSIEYSWTTKSGGKPSKEMFNLSEDNIQKIAESLKYLEDAKSVDYSPVKREVSTEIGVMEIYDKEDLEKAKSLLGFNPKLPLKINNDVSIKNSSVGVSYVSDIKNNKIIYDLNSFYTNKNGSITFWEGKNSKEYDEIKKNGYFTEKNWKTNEDMQIKAEKLNVNNIEVFKYIEKGIEDEKAGSANYLWKEDGVYYGVTFFWNIENTDEIAKAFVNSKPIN